MWHLDEIQNLIWGALTFGVWVAKPAPGGLGLKLTDFSVFGRNSILPMNLQRQWNWPLSAQCLMDTGAHGVGPGFRH